MSMINDSAKTAHISFTGLLALIVLLACSIGIVLNCGESGGISTEMILDETGLNRGIMVLLEDVGCKKAIRLANETELLIYVQFRDDSDVETARRAADTAGLYGKRIFVERGNFDRIHLADNVADALVAFGKAATVSETEALRVIRPGGKALAGSKIYIKHFPEGADDWTHPYHGPDNNPQSEDTIARAPYLTQFLAGPYYAPLPQVTVASAGRVFRALGHIAFKPREEKYVNTLMAYNGYNGTILWTRDLTPGIMIHRNTMIATPTTVYLGDNTSCKLIDAETGELKDEIIPPTGNGRWNFLEMDGVSGWCALCCYRRAGDERSGSTQQFQ